MINVKILTSTTIFMILQSQSFEVDKNKLKRRKKKSLPNIALNNKHQLVLKSSTKFIKEKVNFGTMYG